MDITIQRTKSIGTKLVMFSAWKLANQSYTEPGYSTITTINGLLYGQIGTEYTPRHVLVHRNTPEWFAAYDGWRKSTYNEAYNVIVAEHEEAKPGKRDMGQIEIWL